MKLTDMNGNKKRAYLSIGEALGELDLSDEEYYAGRPLSLGVGRDEEGIVWFAVGKENVFTNCCLADLFDWRNWFEEEWIEKEDNDESND